MAPPRSCHLRHLFPYLPKQPGYNKRLRKAAELVRQVIRELATDAALWTDVYGWWTPHRSNAAVPGRRSSVPTWPDALKYGYCASHSR